MKIYTKNGDRGFTSLFGGSKVWKADPRLEAYGSCDELNSLLGWALVEISKSSSLQVMTSLLEKIQALLFVIGSQLATDNADMRKKLSQVSAQDTESLEQAIDKMNEVLPDLKNFILPGGCEAASRLHLARTMSRRAERAILYFYQECDESDEVIMAFMNRLSDFLFVAARFANHNQGTGDVAWKGK